MSNSFEKAFNSLTDCVTNLGKGVEELVEGLMTEKENEEGSKIRIKKGSKVFLGKGVFVKLLSDVDAEILDEPAADSPKKE